MRWLAKRDQQSGQQEPQLGEEQAKVVTGGGEDGVEGIAAGMRQVVAPPAVLGLEMADDGLDGSTASDLTLVAAMSMNEDTFEPGAD
jgi:hypothetical protein